jgi:hypothetical protein
MSKGADVIMDIWLLAAIGDLFHPNEKRLHYNMWRKIKKEA